MPVYLIRAGDTEMVKIGWAQDPEDRRRDLQTAHYEALTIIRTIDTIEAGERWMHRRFASQRVRMEWFRLHSDMMTVAIPDLNTVFMLAHPDPILPEIERFLSAAGMTATAFGRIAAGDPTLVHELRRGREVRRGIRRRIEAFIQSAQPQVAA